MIQLNTEKNQENKADSTYRSYLSFKLNDEMFATSVHHIQNIMDLAPITPVPKSPKHLKGVVNLRGNVLPVIDTRIKFGLTPVDFEQNPVILVLEIYEAGEPIQVGALVDAVDAVFEAYDEELAPPPTVGSKYKSEYISQVLKRNGSFTHMINTEKLFTTNPEEYEKRIEEKIAREKQDKG